MRDTPIHGNKTVLVSAQQPRGLVLYSISVGNGKLVQESSDPNAANASWSPVLEKRTWGILELRHEVCDWLVVGPPL